MNLRAARFFAVVTLGILLSGCHSHVPLAPTQPTHLGRATQPVYVGITISPSECELIEAGSGVNPNAVKFSGAVSERNPYNYDCAVEIPIPEFEVKLGVCVMRSHNYSTTYFYKGKPEDREYSCDVRPLANGNMYFHASGINADNCGWVCFPAGTSPIASVGRDGAAK